MLWIVCGTADGLIGVNRQFKDWLRSKNVAVHRAGSAGHGARVAALAAESYRHGAETLSADSESSIA